ncbi:hypothetical protein H8788_05465 [Parabacteroides faecis]|uniref:hypothetical protein n=1 Tax=Parabacteroides TaxID=375288 RepID=UPI0011C4733E|nr:MULTISPECIES: hypothetical protein [Parabacteroides]MBC8617178.1 hypothetical protein [Parabacteroides faecis]
MKTRRTFLKQSTTAALGLLAVPSVISMTEENRTRKTTRSTLKNDVMIETIMIGDEFLGLGSISIGGIELRSPRRPMFVEITTPDGIRLLNYRLVDQKITDDSIELIFSADQINDGLMEWMLHTVRNRRNLSDWTEGPQPAKDTTLKLILKPLTREIGNKTWQGFTYQYVYNSSTLPIYRILDRGTWEIGGDVIGNEFWMRSGVVPSKVKFGTNKDFYSSEWYLPGIENPNIFQFHPLQTTLQGFTFTTSSKGTLLTWPNEVKHINSLFEKEEGKSELVHYHEHCADLGHELKTSPVEVLWLPGELTEVQAANIYEAAKDVIYDILHENAGLKRERVTTYGVIEEWQIPDMDKYINRAMPAFIAAELKTVFLPNECQNTMNVYGVSNMCCNIDYKIADTVGEDNMRQLCKKANDAGVTVEMWGNTAISSLAEMFSYAEEKPTDRLRRLPVEGSVMEVVQKAQMPWIRNASNAIEADHYTPRFCALNMRDPDIYAYWMKCWKKLHDDIGIRGIFLDSSFNMTSNKFHHVQNMNAVRKGGATLDQLDNLGYYRPKKEPAKGIFSQYPAHISMIRDMQEMGYHYTGEDIGVFGVHRSGPGVKMRLDCMYIWTDCIATFEPQEIRNLGFDPLDVLFKGLAYRMSWFVFWDVDKEKLVPVRGKDDEFPTFDFFKAYNEVEPYLYDREILENEAGVLYHKDNTYVLWAFSDFHHHLPKSSVVKTILSGKSSRMKEIRASKNQVYTYTI